MIPQPTLCAVCRGHANSPHGYCGAGRSAHKRATIHSCADPRCINLLPKVYDMPRTTLEAYERKAMIAGGNRAGAYLDGEEKYHLGELSEVQWQHFCSEMIMGFQEEIVRLIETGEAPF